MFYTHRLALHSAQIYRCLVSTDYYVILRVLRIYRYSSNLFAQLCIIICGVFRVYLRVGYSWLIPVSHSLAARAHTFPITIFLNSLPSFNLGKF